MRDRVFGATWGGSPSLFFAVEPSIRAIFLLQVKKGHFLGKKWHFWEFLEIKVYILAYNEESSKSVDGEPLNILERS